MSRWLFLIPVIVAVLAYANTVPGDFVFDDVVLIEQGTEIKEFDLRRILAGNYWGPDRADRNWRPLILLSYAVNYWFSEGPWSFHVVNVLLNAAVTLLAFLIMKELLGDARLAALGASIYTVLSVHTEAVANIVGRAELMAGLAIFGAWYLALRNPDEKRVGPILGAAAVTFLGLLCKENTAVVPLILVLVSPFIGRRIPVWTTLATGLSVVVYLGCRTVILGDKIYRITMLDNPLVEAGIVDRVANAIGLLGLHMYRIVFPLHLSADYSYNQIPVRSLGDPVLLGSVAAVLCILIVPVVALRRRMPLAAGASVFFFVTILPVANILFPVGTVMGERLSYVPSFAWPMVLCAVGSIASQQRDRWRFVVAAGCVLVLLYGARTVIRNVEWSDANRLYLTMGTAAPNSTRSHFKVAEACIALANDVTDPKRKDAYYRRADQAAARAVEIHPSNGRAIAQRGLIRLRMRRFGDALKFFNQAIKVLGETKISEPVVYRFRGETYLNLNQSDAAMVDLNGYMKILDEKGRKDAFAFYYRGLVHAQKRDIPAALRDFERALQLRDDLPEFWNNRGYSCYLLGKYDEALKSYYKGIEACKAKGAWYRPRGVESVYSFWTRIADLHRKNQREDEAKKADAEAEKAKRRETGR